MSRATKGAAAAAALAGFNADRARNKLLRKTTYDLFR